MSADLSATDPAAYPPSSAALPPSGPLPPGTPPPAPFVPPSVEVPAFPPVRQEGSRPGVRGPARAVRPSRWSGGSGRPGPVLALLLAASALLLSLWGSSAEAPEPSPAERAREEGDTSRAAASPGPDSASGPDSDASGAGDAGRSGAARQGLVLAPVRLADAEVARLLSPGDRVDVLASHPEGAAGARVVARHARVARLPATAGGQEQAAASEGGGLVVLSVPQGTARSLAGAGAHSRLTVSLR